jgi:hypothetical protein
MNQKNIEETLTILKYLLEFSSERDKRESPHSAGQDFWTFNIQRCISLLQNQEDA